MMSGSRRMEEIRAKISKVARVSGALKEPVWTWKELRRMTKMKVYNATVAPTLMYTSWQYADSRRQESLLALVSKAIQYAVVVESFLCLALEPSKTSEPTVQPQ